MEAKIYVVTTNIKRDCEKVALELVKRELLFEYNGLTVYSNCSGLCVNDKNEIENDNVEVWEVISHNLDITFLQKIAQQLKRICTQTTQFFTIDGKPFYL